VGRETIVPVATWAGMSNRRTWAATAMLAVVSLSACTSSEPAGDAVAEPTLAPATVSPDAAAAVWQLAETGTPDPKASTFDVLVTRVACRSGVTGHVVAPSIQQSADRVVVTFEVTPKDDVGRCPSNDWVAYRISLGEPLGDRTLVDGRCLPGGELALTYVCDSLHRLGDPSGTRS
jgi:hypothetical protein